MLKKAGMIVAVAATGLLAVSSVVSPNATKGTS